MENLDSSYKTHEHILKVQNYLKIINLAIQNIKNITVANINSDVHEMTLVDLLGLLYFGESVPSYDKLFENVNMNSKIYMKQEDESNDELLKRYIEEIDDRAINHDKTKLESPEKEEFDRTSLRLKTTTYGSAEYNMHLKELKNVLYHHYRYNRHHPEHFGNSIYGMNIMDLIEMLCDWKAATEQHDDGNIYRSIILNKERFHYSTNMEKVLTNTVDKYLIKKKTM